jgi:integrase
MSGCRPLTTDETAKVLTVLRNPRDRALFILGTMTGFRVSELLSLTIQDVLQQGQMVDRIRVFKRNTKGKVQSRTVALHQSAKEALKIHLEQMGDLPPTCPLFLSRNQNQSLKPISRFQAHGLLKAAYAEAGLIGHLATHTMRKSFAKRLYAAFNKDLILTQKALGHKSILSTVSYLEADQTEVDQAVLSA